MDGLIAILLSWGLVGLIVAAFTEAFCSPIPPDVVLIPLAFAYPEYAIYYGIVATAASMAGGFIGYGIGNKLGLSAARKIMPEKYIERIQAYIHANAKWAIFLAAMSPIPYKFISITAGAMKINRTMFLIISCIGRGKRFLIEGILIYYYGPQAVDILTNHSNDLLVGSVILLVVGGVIAYTINRMKKNAALDRS